MSKDAADSGIERLSPAKRELLRRLRAEAGPRRLGDSPVAVIGLALRLPGAPARGDYWELLAESRDAITEVPARRWAIDELYNPDPQHPGTVTTRWGGFIEDVEQFDAGLFAISPREAATMDPQHRLLLETSYLALEDAGLNRKTLAGSATGVFVATYQRDYAKLANLDRRQIDAYTASGTHHSMVAGRLAYLYDLHGPALVVDTACSSSLVALHLACRSLVAGEIELALVAASNLMLTPEETIALSRWGMLAPDGRCKPFDSRANGFVRGEGVVCLVLARQREAEREHRRIRALVCGTAVNQDGHSNGLTAPNASAQAAVIRAALRDADVEAAAVGYVEAHGTGTALGDPIEMQALRETYGPASEGAPACWVGSVKSNIGHLEAAAGLAGVAKVIACLEHGEIPATLHFRQLNPAIDLSGTRLGIADERRAWASAQPRHAGVSSFGMGGTNAHVILREAPRVANLPTILRSGHVLAISAHEPGALADAITGHARALADCTDLLGYCAGAARGRIHHPQQRVAVVGASVAELLEALGERAAVRGRKDKPPRGVVFCCPGQGGQWSGMGRSLVEREPVFAAALAECDAAIVELAGWSVLACLREDGEERIERVQPMLFSLAIAYAALWRSWGLEPDAVIGHSMGEVAAAVIAGRLSLADGARVIVRRSALMGSLPSEGAMVAVDLPGAELERVLEQFLEQLGDHEVSLAAENGPRASVLAGPRARMDALVQQLEARGHRCRRIAVRVASHSPAVDVLDDPLAAALAGLDPRPGSLGFYSTVAGRRLDAHTPLDADYWRRNLRQTVRLWSAVRAAVEDRHELFIELGPHPVLLPAIREGLDELGTRAMTIASGRRDADEQLELCHALAQLYEAGLELDWDRIYAGAPTHASLPSYPFQRAAYWLPQPRASTNAGPHPFLGRRVELPSVQAEAAAWVWTRAVSLDDAPFLRDHLVEGSCVLPGMGSVDLVLSGAREAGLAEVELRGVSFERPIVLREGESLELQLRIAADDRFENRFEGQFEGQFEIWGRGEGQAQWIRRVHGSIVTQREPGADVELTELRARTRATHDHETFYAGLNATGNDWGGAFTAVQTIARDGDDMFAELAIPPSIAAELWRHRFHPALLDACAQAMLSGQLDEHGSLVLADIERVAIYGEAEQVHASWIRVRGQQRRGSLSADVVVVDRAGTRLLEVEGLRVQFIHERQASWFHRVVWQLDAASPAGAVEGGPPAMFMAASEVADASADAQLDALVRRCMELLARGDGARLHVVTRGAVAIDDTAVCDPMQSAIWGLARVLQVELGARFGKLVDLDPQVDLESQRAALLDALARDDDEPMLALRGDAQRYVARLEQRALTPAPGRRSPLARLDPSASYLITGGLGGLGLEMAGHLIDRGARRLILLGRTPLPVRASWAALEPGSREHERVAAVRALEARGAEVHVEALDIGDEAALRSFASGWAAQLRAPIRGVVHAAGVQHPRASAELDADALREDLRAKVAGAIAIDRVFGDALEFLLSFSSAATMLPSPLLAGYTAANAFLDGLASKPGRRMTRSIAWGLLAAGGMAQRHAAARGELGAFADMDVREAFAAIDRVFESPHPAVGVMAIDWTSWLRDHADAARSAYFRSLVSEPTDATASVHERVELGQLDAAARRVELEAYLRRQLGRVLRVPDPSTLDPDAPLTSLGIDSLMALELRNRIEAETGASPAVVELLRGISLMRLVELVNVQLEQAASEVVDEDWEEFVL